MNMLMRVSFVFVALSASLSAGFVAGTQVKTLVGGSRTVENLRAGEKVIAGEDELIHKAVGITSIKSKKINRIVVAETKYGPLSMTEDQKVWDSKLNQWVEARYLTTANQLMTYTSNNAKIQHIHTQEFTPEEEVVVFDVTLDGPHTYFAGKAQFLVHNKNKNKKRSQSLIHG